MKISRNTLALLVMIPSLAGAQVPSPDEERLKPHWQALDANGDGVLSLDEVHPMQAAAMGRSDLDGDGNISLSEYVAYDLDPSGASRIPLADNVEVIADLPYAANEDLRQHLDIYLPKSRNVDDPLPVIAYVHGGAWRTGSKAMAPSQVMGHVDSGRFAAVAIGYRLSWQDPWPAQIYDLKAAIRWIRAHADEYGLDPDRICAMGPSAGGHLVTMLGTTNGTAPFEGDIGPHMDQPSHVQCVINFFGPADLTGDSEEMSGSGPTPVAMLLGGAPDEKQDAARQASPLSHVDASDPPFLIVHGTEDPLVNYAESVALDKALREAGVPVIFLTVEGGGHGDFGAAIPEVDRRVRAFLEQKFHDPSVEVPLGNMKHSP